MRIVRQPKGGSHEPCPVLALIFLIDLSRFAFSLDVQGFGAFRLRMAAILVGKPVVERDNRCVRGAKKVLATDRIWASLSKSIANFLNKALMFLSQ